MNDQHMSEQGRNAQKLERQRNVTRSGKSPVSQDIFFGSLAVIGLEITTGLFGSSHWLGWLILGTIISCILFVLEILRYRFPLPPNYRSARNLAMWFTSGALIFSVLYLLLRGIFRLF